MFPSKVHQPHLGRLEFFPDYPRVHYRSQSCGGVFYGSFDAVGVTNFG